MSIYRGAGGAGDAVVDSSSEALLVRELSIEVQADADAAAASATAAAGSASSASSSASAASTSASNAATSATNASNSASSASTSATNAANSATAAQTAETAAELAETNAETAETNAASSASAAASSATTASTAATNASNSASAASTSATNASNSATSASTSASNASTSATNAASSASAASTSASNAATSETNAASSASSASTSATTATTQAGIATTKASEAATSASNASTNATNAATSATAAQTAQSAAESARDATLAAYDNFDDRYLGSKTSNPTLDNDGNALVAGALYFNSVSGAMQVYTGSAWVAAYVSGTGFLASANNLSDVASTSSARTNLGLVIGTNVQAYDAQLADIAALTPTDNTFIVGNGTNFVAEDASTARTSLGLGTIATQAANNVNITGGSVAGITDLAVADGGTGASDASGARTNLGLAIGTNVQAYDAQLDTLAGMSSNRASFLASENSFTFRNRLINGDMTIDQRNAGASVGTGSGVSVYTVDRWATIYSQTSKVTIQQNAGSVTPPAGFKNYAGITSSSAYSIGSTDFFLFRQAIEGFNVADLNWGTASAQSITISFWVRSSLTGTFGATVMNSAANRSYPFTYTISAANTWEQKSVTIAGDTSGTWLSDNGVGLYLQFGLGVGSTYSGTAGSWTGTSNIFGATGATSVVGTNGATFYITGVQLERGTQATSFEYRQYGTELALCQRYYQLAGGAASGSFDGSTTIIQITEKLLVTMRANPTAAIQPSGFAGFRSSANDFNAASPALSNFSSSTPTSFWTQVTGFTGGTSNAVVTGRNNNANNNFIALSAEL